MSPAPDSTAAPAAEVHIPTETEIYLLPDGRVVIADLPQTLAHAVAALGRVEPCEIVGEQTAPQSVEESPERDHPAL